MQDFMPRPYTTTDISKLGIKLGRLKEWVALGYIEPSIQKASGAGTKSLFTRWDLYRIKLFEYMTDRGFTREEASFRVQIFPTSNIRFLSSDNVSKETKQTIYQQAKKIVENPYIAFFCRKPAEDDKSHHEFNNLFPGIPYSSLDNPDPIVLATYRPGDNLEMDILKDYDDIFIINFKKIKDLVDSLID